MKEVKWYHFIIGILIVYIVGVYLIKNSHISELKAQNEINKRYKDINDKLLRDIKTYHDLADSLRLSNDSLLSDIDTFKTKIDSLKPKYIPKNKSDEELQEYFNTNY